MQIFRIVGTIWRSVNIANAEFKGLSPNEVRDVYRQWCHDTGSTGKMDFLILR